eukprot:scaffold468_cov430-Prasinococcus_capsulatus_cf.AAC.4
MGGLAVARDACVGSQMVIRKLLRVRYAPTVACTVSRCSSVIKSATLFTFDTVSCVPMHRGLSCVSIVSVVPFGCALLRASLAGPHAETQTAAPG